MGPFTNSSDAARVVFQLIDLPYGPELPSGIVTSIGKYLTY